MDGFIGLYGLEHWWKKELTNRERKIIEANYLPIGLPDSIGLTKGRMSGQNQSILSFFSSIVSFLKNPETYNLANKIIEYSMNYIEKATNIIDVHYFYQNCIQIHYRNRENDLNSLERAIIACEKQIAISDEVAAEIEKQFIKENDKILQAENDINRMKKLINEVPELKKIYDERIEEKEKELIKLKENPQDVNEILLNFKLPEHLGFKQLAIIKDKKKDYQGVIDISQKAYDAGWSGDWERRIEKARKKVK